MVILLVLVALLCVTVYFVFNKYLMDARTFAVIAAFLYPIVCTWFCDQTDGYESGARWDVFYDFKRYGSEGACLLIAKRDE
jgi:hypothetical protein